jgi:hypothetical protein
VQQTRRQEHSFHAVLGALFWLAKGERGMVDALPDIDFVCLACKIIERSNLQGEIEEFAVMAASTTKALACLRESALALEAAIEMAASFRGAAGRPASTQPDCNPRPCLLTKSSFLLGVDLPEGFGARWDQIRLLVRLDADQGRELGLLGPAEGSD